MGRRKADDRAKWRVQKGQPHGDNRCPSFVTLLKGDGRYHCQLQVLHEGPHRYLEIHYGQRRLITWDRWGRGKPDALTRLRKELTDPGAVERRATDGGGTE